MVQSFGYGFGGVSVGSDGFHVVHGFGRECSGCNHNLQISEFIDIARVAEKALRNINRQLEKLHLKVKPTEGAIVDATIIESAAAPRKTIETVPVDREKESDALIYEASDVQLSADKDARWVKKRGKNYFGYKETAA